MKYYKVTLRENGLQRPAKGGSTPAFACGSGLETSLLGIPPESGSARLGHIPSLPWESQLPLKPCISLQPSDFEGNCDSLRFSHRFLLHFIVQFDLLRKCGLLAHTSAAFLKNCCTEKFFSCLRLDSYSRLFLNMRQICNLHQHICH